MILIVELERKCRSSNTIDGYEKVCRRSIQPTLGTKQVTKVTMKMLTDLYGAHQRRGLSARSVYQIHACLLDVHAGLPVGLARLEPGAQQSRGLGDRFLAASHGRPSTIAPRHTTPSP